jgi:RNA ligase (TIGR02306 family)
MRKLASIQKITNIRPIPGADMIETADVLGWSVVVTKGDFAVGDLAVYYEIDAFLNSNDPRYASFEPRFTNWGSKRGMRLKTIKLRKQISQGLLLKVKDFPEIKNPTEGDDVTELLKIEKWESSSEANANSSGANSSWVFPSFIFKTDQERVQNSAGQIVKNIDEDYEASIKLDGSSMTVFHLNKNSAYFESYLEEVQKRNNRKLGFFGKLIYALKKKFGKIASPDIVQGVCSRNVNLDPKGDSTFANYAKDQSIFERLSNRDQNIALQGELIAPSIQGNYEKVDGFEYYIYDVFDIDQQAYMLPESAREVVESLGLNYVPVLAKSIKLTDLVKEPGVLGDLNDLRNNDVGMRALTDAILAYAEGPGKNPGVKREGVVFKSNKSQFSFKAISNSYLLKQKD